MTSHKKTQRPSTHEVIELKRRYLFKLIMHQIPIFSFSILYSTILFYAQATHHPRMWIFLLFCLLLFIGEEHGNVSSTRSTAYPLLGLTGLLHMNAAEREERKYFWKENEKVETHFRVAQWHYSHDVCLWTFFSPKAFGYLSHALLSLFFYRRASITCWIIKCLLILPVCCFSYFAVFRWRISATLLI